MEFYCLTEKTKVFVPIANIQFIDGKPVQAKAICPSCGRRLSQFVKTKPSKEPVNYFTETNFDFEASNDDYLARETSVPHQRLLKYETVHQELVPKFTPPHYAPPRQIANEPFEEPQSPEPQFKQPDFFRVRK